MRKSVILSGKHKRAGIDSCIAWVALTCVFKDPDLFYLFFKFIYFCFINIILFVSADELPRVVSSHLDCCQSTRRNEPVAQSACGSNREGISMPLTSLSLNLTQNPRESNKQYAIALNGSQPREHGNDMSRLHVTTNTCVRTVVNNYT